MFNYSNMTKPLHGFAAPSSSNPNYGLVQANLAATLALTGNQAEAHEALARYLSLPGTQTKTIAAFKKAITISDNSVYLAALEHLYDGLRKAGMPEQ